MVEDEDQFPDIGEPFEFTCSLCSEYFKLFAEIGKIFTYLSLKNEYLNQYKL